MEVGRTGSPRSEGEVGGRDDVQMDCVSIGETSVAVVKTQVRAGKLELNVVKPGGRGSGEDECADKGREEHGL